MSLKERLRGVVSAVAAAALALAAVPMAASAVTLESGTATVNGVTGATEVRLYRVATVADSNNDNQLEVTFKYGSYELADWEANPAGVANDIDGMVAADAEADYSQILNGQTDTVSFTDVEPGLYLVRVTPRDAGVVYQTTIMKVMPAAQSDGSWGVPAGEITLKKGEDNVNTSLTKEVSADGETGWADSIDTLGAGDKAYFRVQVDIPQYNGLSAEDDITFTLTDTLPNGLTYVADSACANIGEVSVSGDSKTVTVVLDAADLVAAADPESGTDTLTLTLSATVDSGQLGRLTNSAVVQWYQHVNDDDPVSTDPVTASVVVYGASVTKRVGYLNSYGQIATSASQDALNGAEFVLEKYNNETTEWDPVIESTEANPTLAVTSLGSGHYRWRETKAPAGYQLNKGTLEFSVNASVATESNNYTVVRQFGDLADDSIVQLPQTGGPGTIALTVVGVGLIAGAAVWAVRSRKEN